MPKSLADLRAGKPVRRQERSYTACLAQHLVAEVGSLTDEHDGIEQRIARLEPAADSASSHDPPRRGAGSPHLRELKDRRAEIATRLQELLTEMGEYEGEFRVRAIDDGDWRRWVNEHPARDKDAPGHRRDLEVTGGYCDADDLIDDLATYVKVWNGDEMRDGDWDHLAPSVSGADKKQLARLVVSMHESDTSIPKWRSRLSDSLRNESDSPSPASSESLTSDSTDGNPPSDTSTTTPTES